MKGWIGGLAKLRWAIVIAWLAAATLSFFYLPDLQAIVRNTEQKFLPASAESVQATHLMQRINPSSRSLSNAVIVLSRDKGLSTADLEWMDDLLRRIDSDKEELKIISVLSAATQPELAERLRSHDGTTILAVVNLPRADFDEETKIALNKIKQLLESVPNGAQARLTGTAMLSQDFQQSSENGLRRTEALTVGIVLLILLIVFRSPVTPLIPLVTIGISFILSRGLIGFAARFGVPVSHFTESFLIAVLFGAGTDYCILLLQRYREELRSQSDGNRAVALTKAMSGVTRTILYSASTVFAAFVLIGFAEFGLYRSAVGVAIGMVVTVAAALTLTPALILLFGHWISGNKRVSPDHAEKESRVWAKLSSLCSRKSGLVLLSSFILLLPLSLLFQGKRSFDDISEINPQSDSVQGFRQVEKAFGIGEAFPVTVVVTSMLSMRSSSGLAALEQASATLAAAEGVSEVRSAVRPLGRKPEQLTVPGQLKAPNVGDIVQAIMNEQQTLIEGLKTIALGAVPLSHGWIGIVPAVRLWEDGLSKLVLSQLGGLKRISGPEGRNEGTKPISAERQAAMDYYISPDGHTTKFELILSTNPYSAASMDAIPVIAGQLRDSLDATALTDPQVFVTGVSAKYNELRGISYVDFIRTAALVLIGIFAVLVLMLRSIIAPLYVLLSLGINYFVTMGITEFVFVKALGFPGLSWTVSFFVFLVIVALGVDYSIFLMARYKEEYRPGHNAAAMAKAMRTTGGVIGSAAVIMAGTFGALSFSGVDTLVQIGIGTLIGLLLYATIFMTLVVPAFSFLLGELNWWPFKRDSSL
ncbi:MMPL family transporter [Cohnella endophytica]|uniref:MMPL family transporter n=1 Tax=Cohnella endophytica TaxID=2419778 RepID=A0A494XTF6_9BACL|nr:MMPL family transporter [Cohnella endophytica]RKP53933.1 MMPL family transporter [Cohnella endophytica]